MQISPQSQRICDWGAYLILRLVIDLLLIERSTNASTLVFQDNSFAVESILLQGRK